MNICLVITGFLNLLGAALVLMELNIFFPEHLKTQKPKAENPINTYLKQKDIRST